jgi:tRNA nucleotidyltransferase (CCA-adding enzyme)
MSWDEMKDELSKVIEKARAIVTPTKKEEAKLSRVSAMVRDLLEQSFATAHVVPEILLGGSYAKGTWLRGSGDIDFYLLYPLTYPREKLEGEAIEISQRAVKGFEIRMRFAEHPYVECLVEGVRVNIVPCYKASKGEWQSAADRSPFHTEYICSRFDDSLRGETRILKKYVKSLGLYGAEVKTQGLSGYVCEVLTLKFGSFVSVLENVSNLKAGEVISVEDYDPDVARSFNSKLVILDPVDTNRNLGTAISARNVSRIMLESRAFLSNPSTKFFSGKARLTRKRENDETEKALLERTLIVVFKNQPRSVDILWGQLGKSLGAVAQVLSSLGFDVLRSKASSNEKDESAFIVLLTEKEISAFKRRVGPETHRHSDVDRFLEKNKHLAKLSWIDDDGKVNLLFERDIAFREARSALKNLLSDSNRIDSIGLAKEVKREISNGFSIYYGLDFARKKHEKRIWLDNDLESIVNEEIEV